MRDAVMCGGVTRGCVCWYGGVTCCGVVRGDVLYSGVRCRGVWCGVVPWRGVTSPVVVWCAARCASQKYGRSTFRTLANRRAELRKRLRCSRAVRSLHQIAQEPAEFRNADKPKWPAEGQKATDV